MNKELRERLHRLTQGVCHRGLHDLEKPENSMAAFAAAIEQGLPFEFDLHLSKDGHLIVCHDSDLSRMTGKQGIVEEFTREELEENFRLPDGSKLPRFEEVLELNHGQVPMVIELKAYKDNAGELAKAAIPVINEIPNVKDCYVISFSFDALVEARACGCIPPLGFLISTEAIKHATKEMLYEFDFLDVEVHYSMLPRFKKYRKAGGSLMCWTVKSRLTHWIGKHRCDALTWEKVDSAKPVEKVNRFIEKHMDPRFREDI